MDAVLRRHQGNPFECDRGGDNLSFIAAVATARVESHIREVRGQRVILDRDLAEIYGVPTRRLNEQFRRNAEKFPEDFAFILDRQEVVHLKSQFATSSLEHGGRRKPPRAFTEHGALMAAFILNSPRAVEMSVFVVRAFVELRRQFSIRDELAKRLYQIERKLQRHDTSLQEIHREIKGLRQYASPPPGRQIGFKTG